MNDRIIHKIFKKIKLIIVDLMFVLLVVLFIIGIGVATKLSMDSTINKYISESRD